MLRDRARVRARVKALARGAAGAMRTVLGSPDYAAYLDHMRRHHPGETPLGPGEHLAWALARRHAGRARCC